MDIPSDYPKGKVGEIIALLEQGYTPKEIAEQMSLSLRAVKHHLYHLYVSRGYGKDRLKYMMELIRLPEPSKEEVQPCPIHITKRQWELIRLITDGYKSFAVGEKLGISALSVKNYLQIVYNLTGTNSRAELLQWYRYHEHPDA